MAYEWLDNCLSGTAGLTFSEKRSLVLANQAGGMILPGERYLRQTLKDEGGFWEFWARPELHRICLKLEMYET